MQEQIFSVTVLLCGCLGSNFCKDQSIYLYAKKCVVECFHCLDNGKLTIYTSTKKVLCDGIVLTLFWGCVGKTKQSNCSPFLFCIYFLLVIIVYVYDVIK